MSHRFTAAAHRLGQAAVLAAVAGVLAPGSAAVASDLDTIGLTQLLSLDPTLTGSAVRVAQPEADAAGSGTNTFEVSPAGPGQPASLFTYTSDTGTILSPFSTANESNHADNVADFFYGTIPSAITPSDPHGVAPGVAHVDSISADYFIGTMVPNLMPIGDAVVNQSFIEVEDNGGPLTVADQQASDTQYDNYVDDFGTIIVSAVGNAGSDPHANAPSTAYNVISVAAFPGPSSVGPTIDDGRSKPDITAPGGFTSYSTPLVSGAAAILVQAGARGDGGASAAAKTDAVDWRTVEALLLNGADKQAVSFTRTATTPLDPTHGAGLLNIDQSYLQLAAGMHPYSSLSNTSNAGGPHAPDKSGTVIPALSGWDFETVTSPLTADIYANYLFRPAVGVSSYTLAATVIWARQFNSNPNTVMGINNIDLYLYDTTTNTLIDTSDSAVDNVQDVYDLHLAPGDLYDLEVLKQAGGVSAAETYALAFNFAAVQSVWNASGGGTWNQAANWTGGVPQNPGDAATFAGAITANSIINLTGSETVGNINFKNSHSYTIAPSAEAVIALNNSGKTANIIDTLGSHTIAAAMVMSGGVAITIATAGQTLTLSGGISGTGGMVVSGAGKLVLSGTGNAVSALTINSSATVDIAAGGLAINFANPAADPATTIRSYLTTGYNGGAWTGMGLTSSAAAANPRMFSVGYADGNSDARTTAAVNQILIRYTLAGDATLDGSVGFDDLVILAQNFGNTGEDWAEGNFTYDPGGSVGFGDLVLLAQNFGDSISMSSQNDPLKRFEETAATPEPGMAVLLAAAGLLGGRRRQRRRLTNRRR